MPSCGACYNRLRRGTRGRKAKATGQDQGREGRRGVRIRGGGRGRLRRLSSRLLVVRVPGRNLRGSPGEHRGRPLGLPGGGKRAEPSHPGGFATLGPAGRQTPAVSVTQRLPSLTPEEMW